MDAALLNYLNLIVGAVGTAATLLASPDILQIGARLRAAEGDRTVLNVVPFVRVFSTLLLLAAFLFLVGLGLAGLLHIVVESYGGNNPMLTSSLMIVGLFAGAGTATLAVARSSFFFPACVASFCAAVLSIIAALDETLSGFSVALVISCCVFAVSGIAGILHHVRAHLP